jgi:hypothetical protein
MGATATVRGRAAADKVGRSSAVQTAARVGLAARAAFYLLLAGLVARMAFDGGSAGHQTNAHGALSVIAQTVAGKVAIAAAALGFLVLGLVRVAGAVRDRQAELPRRLVTGAQGVFYAALTWVPLSFLFGDRSTGSEQAQKQQTASMLSWPMGRELVVVAGLVVMTVCAVQIRAAVTQDFTEGLQLRRAPAWVCRLVEAAGTVGIAARAVVFLPVGVFLVVAAVQADPQHSKGIDAELALLARQSWWGPLLLGLVALGLVVFAVYAGLDARYRKVGRAG